jgi:hypothetical protein
MNGMRAGKSAFSVPHPVNPVHPVPLSLLVHPAAEA